MIDTINLVNREAARILSKDETLVKLVNRFFWKEGVKEAVQSAQHTSIRIPKIGTLVISRNKVNKKILRIIQSIRELQRPEKTFKEKTREQCLTERYTELTLMLKRRNDIAIAYKNNIDRHKAKYELHKTDMGEPPVDNAGTGIKALLFTGD